MWQFPIRRLHTSAWYRAIDKAALSKLRKKTGVSYINCKKALEKFNNDVSQAEVWLKEEAQKQGWAKVSKLEGRAMRQGLIGVTIDGNSAAMVEVNCETDFVARNTKFQSLVSQISNICLQNGKSTDSSKIYWEKDEFNKLSIDGAKSVSDLVALEVGNLGENMKARRGVVIKTDGDFMIGSYVHSSGSSKKDPTLCKLGKFASLMRYRQTSPVQMKNMTVEEVARQLCQHIVGMNPDGMGTADDTPLENKEEETRMIHQEFLLDPSMLVHEVLEQNSLEIKDYVRFECGEELASEKGDVAARQQV